jgi:hypothetical protein
VRRISTNERRARLARRHHLAAEARTNDVVTIATDLTGLHATDPATVFLSTAARMKQPAKAVSALERALYDDRALVRTLCMRRTMFVVPLEFVPIVQAACTDALVPGERKRAIRMIEDNGIAEDGQGWLRAVEAETMAALEEHGELAGSELSKIVPALRAQLSFGEGKTWAGTSTMTTRVLFLLSTEQRVVRGRPKGSWTSSQYRWSPMDRWIDTNAVALERRAARAALADRWLHSFGPATTADLAWWTGWTVRSTREALVDIDAVEVSLAEGSGWVAAGDDGAVRAVKPWVALLPALDPTTMGWKDRRWYLGAHGNELFDRNGNAGPTLWVDGHVVGGWGQRRSGEIAYRLLEDVGREAVDAVEAAAHALQTWFGPVRVTPRFPTPLQRTLAN